MNISHNFFSAHTIRLHPEVKISLKVKAKTEKPKLCAYAITEPHAGSDVEDREAS